MYFFTRSKKANSSVLAADIDAGGSGSGRMGVNVGDTAAASAANGLLL